MSNTTGAKTDPDQPTVYHIRIQGHLGPHWADWLGGLSLTLEENGETLVSGPVADQAALHGLLRKVRDSGLTLLSVMRVEPNGEGAPDANRQRDKRHETEACA